MIPFPAHAAYDPPEYVAAAPQGADDVAAFQRTIDADPERAAVVAGLDAGALLGLWRGLARARMLDRALARLVRQGRVAKAWLATGEEAATVGPVRAILDAHHGAPAGPVIAPLIRNLAACLEAGMPMADVLRAHLGTADAPSRGRDGHVGDLRRGILQPISHLGDTIPVVAGVALSFRLRGERRAALAWIGDGATKTGAAHEGLDFAAVQRVPAVVVVQNNQVALGTLLAQHHRGRFADWPRAYGMWGAAADGNHVLDAYAATYIAVSRCLRGEGPALLVLETFRMGGHATHDAAEARRVLGDAPFAAWGGRDPLARYAAWLVARGIDAARLRAIADDAADDAADAEREALASAATRMPAGETAIEGVWAPTA